MSGLVNYTTKAPVSQSLAEMQERVAAAGADHIGVGYEDGLPVSLTFMLRGPHGPRHFTVPVDVDAVARLIRVQHDAGRLRSGSVTKAVLLSREHAARVAWRVMKDWLASTLVLVEAKMLRLDEVMLPYLMVDEDRTLAQAYREREGALAIASGEDS